MMLFDYKNRVRPNDAAAAEAAQQEMHIRQKESTLKSVQLKEVNLDKSTPTQETFPSCLPRG